MALFIVGMPCRICGAAIVEPGTFVGLPVLPTLPTFADNLSDSCMHRRCLVAFHNVAVIRQHWRDWWLELARKGAILRDDPHGLLFRHWNGDRVVFVNHPRFIVIEEDASALPRFSAFFRHQSEFPGGSQSLTFKEYRVLDLGETVKLDVVAEQLRGVSEGRRLTEKVVILSESFSRPDWVRFCSSLSIS